MINKLNTNELNNMFKNGNPFKHVIIDNFLNEKIAIKISNEFPLFDSDKWRKYNNQIEVKKLTNHYDNFGLHTYNLFHELNASNFIDQLKNIVNLELIPDYGLNGGGLHIHKKGGKLNTHLDYSVHPKLDLERRINLILYLTPDWNEKWNGGLGLWEGDKIRPNKLIKTITPKFNRAVIFDTSENSWHGLPEPLKCPDNIFRKSLAVYYLTKKRVNISERGKALFSPYGDQENDKDVLELIKMRSQTNTASAFYEKKIEPKE